MNYLISRRQTIRALSLGAISLGVSCQRSSDGPVPFTPIRFAVASDGHFGEPGTPWEKYFSELINALTQTHAENPLQFAVVNGDIVHRTAPHLLLAAKAYLDRLPFPYYVTRGNHDVVSNEVWESVWGYQPNKIVLKKETTLILLDTSNQAGDVLCADPAWLTNALQQVPNDLPVFIFMHIPFLRNEPVQMCSEFTATLAQQSNIRAIFHGHDHSKDTGVQIGRQAVLFDGRFGSSWGTTYRGYRIVERQKPDQFLTYQVNLENNTKVNESSF